MKFGPTAAGALILLAACGAEVDAQVAPPGAPVSAGSPAATETACKNVVLVVIDTLRADRLGCYGYPRGTSPAIDALAERGTLYARNHSQGCWTIPSMVSMMSGLYVTEEESGPPKEHKTLAEVLKEAGLRTADFIGNPILARDRGIERGVPFQSA